MLQGDTLAPFLFVNALDYAMRKALGDDEKDLGFTITPRRSRRHPKEVLSDLDFADDIALLSDKIAQAHELFSHGRDRMQESRTWLERSQDKSSHIQYP